MNYIFFHGGPGFNSNPEVHLFKDAFNKSVGNIAFWNQPSQNRSSTPVEHTFSELIKSAKAFLHSQGPSTIIAHSFAAHTALALADQCPELITKLIFIAPAFDLHDADKKILGLAIRDFNKEGQAEKADRLQSMLSRLSKDNFNQAMSFALEDAALLLHYWQNAAWVPKYYGHFTPPDFAFDVDGFLKVRMSFEPTLPKKTISIPCMHIFGHEDPIIDEALQTNLARSIFPNSTFISLKGAGHYPHIEQQNEFLTRVKH